MNVTQWDHRARQVTGKQLRKGDAVYDAHGGTHVLRRVRPTRRGTVKVLRVDAPRAEHIGFDTPIVIIPANSLL
jgi:hypothetical protein